VVEWLKRRIAGLDRWQRANRLLAGHPEITRTSVHAAAAAADADALEALLREDPALAVAFFDVFMGVEPNWVFPESFLSRPAVQLGAPKADHP